MLLPLRQRRQLRRVDVDRVLTAVGLIQLNQPGLLRPFAVHLRLGEKHTLVMAPPPPAFISSLPAPLGTQIYRRRTAIRLRGV